MTNNILVTGGCGFVGSSIAIAFRKKYPRANITCLDNLKRKGSETNILKLKERDIEFIHGDIRNNEDLNSIRGINIIIECSAEPSILAGYNYVPQYLINTNLVGTINCLDLALTNDAKLIFLSTSRVYPYKTINSLNYIENSSRFGLAKNQKTHGVSIKGINENFPLDGPRSLYGATKLASELIIQEYVDSFGLKAIINRCGVIAGAGQFGKVDQGFIAFWLAKHYWKQNISYIGFGGEGKQVRDILHIDDLFDLIEVELDQINVMNGETYNVGGGLDVSVSLKELTKSCSEITGNKISLKSVKNNRPSDIRIYLTDNAKIFDKTGWIPKKKINDILSDIYYWIKDNESALKEILL